jgi:hypothetical protein
MPSTLAHVESSAFLRPAARGTLRAIACAGAWLCAASFCAAQTPSLPQVDVVTSTKSVFVDDVNFGKDPFFPRSTRRVATVVPTVKAAPDYSDLQFSLQGLSGTPERRLALINNYTLAAGEEADLRINGELIRVRCDAIKDRTVTISFKGITRELRLRDGL